MSEKFDEFSKWLGDMIERLENPPAPGNVFHIDPHDELASIAGDEYSAHSNFIDDPSYQEWSETIELQNQEFQDWESVQGVRFSMDIDECLSLYHAQ